MSKVDVSVYIGRFNPFHNGHAHVLSRALQRSRLTIVLVGSAGQARSLKNPFTAAERKQMIEAYAKTVDGAGELRVIPLRDYRTNTLWIEAVQSIVNETVKSVALKTNQILTDINLVGSDRDDTTWYLKSFPQWKQDLVDEHKHETDELSGTSVRKVLYESALISSDFERLRTRIPKSTELFLWNFAGTKALQTLRDEHEYIKKYKKSWEAAPYAPTFVTADAVVIQSGHVLVVRRGAMPGEGLIALPGGFVNQRETIKDAAVRELIEETGIRLADGKRSREITESMLNGAIRAKEIFDEPDRSARGRTITTAYLFRLDDTKPLPKVKGQNVPAYEADGKDIVETADAFWMPLDQALSKTDQWFEDHLFIVEWAASIKE